MMRLVYLRDYQCGAMGHLLYGKAESFPGSHKIGVTVLFPFSIPPRPVILYNEEGVLAAEFDAYEDVLENRG
jgi:hypothetical protein